MTVLPLDTETLRHRTLEARMDRYLAGLGFGFNPYLARRAAMSELRQLDALSDSELAARGLNRSALVPHVVSRALGH